MKTGRARYKHFKRKSKQSRTWENFAPCLVQYCGVQLCTTFVHKLASKSRSQLLLYNTPSQCTWKMAMRDANFHSHHHHTWWGGFSRARMLADCPPRRSADEDWARINSAWNGKWLHTTTRCDVMAISIRRWEESAFYLSAVRSYSMKEQRNSKRYDHCL